MVGILGNNLLNVIESQIEDKYCSFKYSKQIDDKVLKKLVEYINNSDLSHLIIDGTIFSTEAVLEELLTKITSESLNIIFLGIKDISKIDKLRLKVTNYLVYDKECDIKNKFKLALNNNLSIASAIESNITLIKETLLKSDIYLLASTQRCSYATSIAHEVINTKRNAVILDFDFNNGTIHHLFNSKLSQNIVANQNIVFDNYTYIKSEFLEFSMLVIKLLNLYKYDSIIIDFGVINKLNLKYFYLLSTLIKKTYVINKRKSFLGLSNMQKDFLESSIFEKINIISCEDFFIDKYIFLNNGKKYQKILDKHLL